MKNVESELEYKCVNLQRKLEMFAQDLDFFGYMNIDESKREELRKLEKTQRYAEQNG